MPSIETPWFEVKQLKGRFGLVDYVETGCDKGVSLSLARAFGFEQLLACDINWEHVDWSKRVVPEAEIALMESTAWLAKLCPKLDRPTLFWLDAHFPYVLQDNGTRDEGTSAQQFPLYEELAAIREFKHGQERDVILCDDIAHIHNADNPRYRPGECDWKHLNPRPLANYVALFSDTHDHRVFMEDTGALLFYAAAMSYMDHLREQVAVMMANGLLAPYRVSLMHSSGITWWYWIDRDGNPIPPPIRITQ